MAYLPDLTAPSSWELAQPPRRGHGFTVVVALFFAVLLCAASAFATAVYLDGVEIDARVALDNDTAGPVTDPSSDLAGPSAAESQDALQAAFVSGRKAGYKRGVTAGRAQAEKAREKDIGRAFAQGRAEGLESGQSAGYSEGYQDASAKYDAAWNQANPAPEPGETAAAGTAPADPAP